MKNLILLLILSVVISVNAQSKASKDLLTGTEWINKDLNYLRFDNDAAVYNFDNIKQEVLFDLDNKSLSFKINYRLAGDFKTEEFKFRIKEINKNRLVIVPVTEKEQANFNKLDVNALTKEKQYIFYNRGKLLDKVNFKKLTFHSSTCFGTCPSMSVQIDIDGTVYYRGKNYTEAQGDFIGKLSKEGIYELKKILNRSQLYSIDKNWEQKSKRNDTPRYTYIVETFDGDKIEINTNDQHPVLDKLSDFLLNIDKKAELKEAEESHDFEKSKLVMYKISQ
ncbi:DUF6438 domain-containing protein [Aureibaculum sp. 2210JD6-5]|uniref:DUF6438 domain-containing protein n=1 Tax=Aureibaculum sp. 2210JD6-5 TaxID=3103957 RepID=UPI002AACEBE3|nr:DUF6438 domain-containing protein [Aureibaculum sp. 2210JD6-5]MDY7393835.1 DUF6438 domain-containing protein [Aureibaculum sp. 2210JD6-5]